MANEYENITWSFVIAWESGAYRSNLYQVVKILNLSAIIR